MRKVLIVNLTRFGDLLQTGPTIQGLKAEDPATHVTVVADKNFARVCDGLPGVDRVWPVDLDALGRRLLADDLHGAYHDVAALLGALRAERFDLALNYSSSRMSAVLLRLVGVPDTRGWTMSDDGHRLIAHPWARLFSASCLVRRHAAFNLVDHYRRVAGVAGGPHALAYVVPGDVRERVRARLADAGVRDGEPLVGMQLGASADARRWPAASFVAVAERVRARLGARIVLVGGKGERAVADPIAAALGPDTLDCVGGTTVPELGALLERVDVLLTADTGPMHMAVAVGTPVVALFFGPALPTDTGPYAPDQLCLHAPVACAPCDHAARCLNPFCRDVLAPDAVADAIVARHAGDWHALAALAAGWPAIGWWRTTLDADGFFDLARLGPATPARDDVLRAAYRALWKETLGGAPPAAVRAASPADAAVLQELAALAGRAHAQAVAVERLARGPRDVRALERAARRLEELDAELARFGAVHDAAAQLLQLHRFEKENLPGDDVRSLAAATRTLHEALERRARRLAELLGGAAADAARGGSHASVA